MDKLALDYIWVILVHAKGRRSYMEYEMMFDLYSQITYRLQYKKSPKTEEEWAEARYMMECNVNGVWEEIRGLLPVDIIEEVRDFSRFFFGFGDKATYKKLQAFYDKIKDEV